MNVLILDDDVELGETLVEALEGDGHQAVLATDLNLARQALASEQTFHVAVLDVNIHADSSFDLLREIKDAMPNMRIVSMTGGGRVRAHVSMPLASAHGADAVLLKPFALDEFFDAVTQENG